MSTADPAAEPNGEPQLSKAELRRRRILAKRGARMALVTGDATLAAADPASSSMREATPATALTTTETSHKSAPPSEATHTCLPPPSRPSEDPPSDQVTPSIPIMPQLPGMRVGGDSSSRKMALMTVPPAVRNLLMAGGGVALPYLRAQYFGRLSALQLFLALEGVMLAPEVATWMDAGALGALVGVARQLSAVWRDLALFLLMLFLSLHFGA